MKTLKYMKEVIKREMKRKRPITELLDLSYCYLRDKVISHHVNYKYAKIYKKNIGKGSTIIGRVLNNDMVMPLKPVGLQTELLVRGIREDISTKKLMKTINKGDVVIDIGGNIGYFALIESDLVGPSGEVYAVEPVIENYVLLNENISLNNKWHNTRTFRLAMGDKNMKGKDIYLSDSCNLHSFVKDIHQTAGTQKVPMQTLDTFVKRNKINRIDFLRMDVEGYETFIIDGGIETLKRFKPKMFIEIHPKHVLNMKNCSIKNMLIKLRDLGYQTTEVCCANRIEKLSMDQLITDYRVTDSTDEERKSGRKATFRVFFEVPK